MNYKNTGRSKETANGASVGRNNAVHGTREKYVTVELTKMASIEQKHCLTAHISQGFVSNPTKTQSNHLNIEFVSNVATFNTECCANILQVYKEHSDVLQTLCKSTRYTKTTVTTQKSHPSSISNMQVQNKVYKRWAPARDLTVWIDFW